MWNMREVEARRDTSGSGLSRLVSYRVIQSKGDKHGQGSGFSADHRA